MEMQDEGKEAAERKVETDLIAAQNEKAKEELEPRPPTMLDTLLTDICRHPGSLTHGYLEAHAQGQQLLNSSVMMEKFTDEKNYEPLVERIFLRNICTRMGGSEAMASLRRSTTDRVVVIDKKDLQDQTEEVSDALDARVQKLEESRANPMNSFLTELK